jgi:hypothetical protein
MGMMQHNIKIIIGIEVKSGNNKRIKIKFLFKSL